MKTLTLVATMSVGIPVITTVIPTYRRPRTLERAIRSVLSQTYPHFQVRVYDDASGDETKDVVARLMKEDPRVKYFCHSSRIGPYANFNYALNRIETQYFSILSDDDALLPDFFDSALKKLSQYPEAMFVAGVSLLLSNNTVVGVSPSSVTIDDYVSPPQSLIAITLDPPTWTSVLFRKEAIERVGTLDLETGGACDQDFELRIAARYPIVLTKQPWALFSVHTESQSARIATTMTEKRFFGMKKLIANISTDDTVPLEVRATVVQKLRRRCERLTYAEGLKAVWCADYEYAQQMAHTLEVHFNDKGKARIIRQVAFLHKYFPAGYDVMRAIGETRRVIRRGLRRKADDESLQRTYGHYLQLTDEA
ncbi:MAG: glycosyltransferase family 2 protein [Halobacteriota archaeon]